MKDGNYKDSCLFGEELISYIYGEVPASGRTVFEDHLLTCSDCVDEFAAVSESRLGVYEWHRDEFLSLETPAFEIPYDRPIVPAEPAFSWLDALRGLLTPARLATTVGAFAVLAIAFGAIYVSFTPSNQLVANVNRRVQPMIEPVLPTETVSSVDSAKNDESNRTIVNERADSKVTKQISRPVQAKVTPRNSVKQNPTQVQASRSVKAPRLGTYDEAEDTSLRLVDLVADIDTYDF